MSKENPNMKLRMPGKDYTEPGYYFCTLVVEGRRHLFGHVTDISEAEPQSQNTQAQSPNTQSQNAQPQPEQSGAQSLEKCCGEYALHSPSPSPSPFPYGHGRIHRGACMAYSPYGQQVARELEAIGTVGRYKGKIEVKGKAILPDHIHVLLLVKEGLPKHIGTVLNGFNTGCRRIWKSLCGFKVIQTEPFILYEPCKEEVKTGRWHLPEGQLTWPKEQADGALSIFEDGYNDQVVYREGQLDGYYRYMEANVWRLLMKRKYPNLFRKVWNKELIPEKFFNLIGNMFLLYRPWRVPVRISRFAVEEEAFDPYDPEGSFVTVNDKRVLRKTRYLYPKREKTPEEIAAAIAPYLQIAKAGAVLVTPCISPGEQEVVQAAYKENKPVVMMCFNGFSPCYHPSAAHYDACSRGILLQLAPWRYDPGRKMTKDLCEELNEMAFRFSGL